MSIAKYFIFVLSLHFLLFQGEETKKLPKKTKVPGSTKPPKKTKGQPGKPKNTKSPKQGKPTKTKPTKKTKGQPGKLCVDVCSETITCTTKSWNCFPLDTDYKCNVPTHDCTSETYCTNTCNIEHERDKHDITHEDIIRSEKDEKLETGKAKVVTKSKVVGGKVPKSSKGSTTKEPEGKCVVVCSTTNICTSTTQICYPIDSQSCAEPSHSCTSSTECTDVCNIEANSSIPTTQFLKSGSTLTPSQHPLLEYPTSMPSECTPFLQPSERSSLQPYLLFSPIPSSNSEQVSTNPTIDSDRQECCSCMPSFPSFVPSSSPTPTMNIIFTFPPIKPLIKNNLIGTVSKPPRTNFRISFNITPYSIINEWTNILRFTDRVSYANNKIYGDKAPALFFIPNTLRLDLSQGSTTNPQHIYQQTGSLEKNVKYFIQIEYVGDIISLYINDIFMGSLSIPINNRPQLNQWLIYASGKLYNAADADLEDLTVRNLPSSSSSPSS